MKLLLAGLVVFGGLSVHAACVPDDGRHWNDLTRSQDQLREVCNKHDYRGDRDYRRGHDYDRGYAYEDDYGYWDGGHSNDFSRSQDHLRGKN